jgi:hypothetical protein
VRITYVCRECGTAQIRKVCDASTRWINAVFSNNRPDGWGELSRDTLVSVIAWVECQKCKIQRLNHEIDEMQKGKGR